MMLFRRWCLVLLAALLALAVGACGGSGEPAPDGSPASDEARSPQRIVVLAPSLTEIVFQLGLGDRVVGVSSYSAWPPEVKEKAQLGGLIDPQLERLASLQPDLAILLPSQADLARQLGGLEVETLTVRGETLHDLMSGIGEIAARCGVERRGRRLVARLRRELAPDPLPGSPRVMLVVGRPPGRLAGLTAVGPDTFLHQLLERLEVTNVAADSPTRYPQLSLEQVLASRPQVIVELVGDRLWEVNRRELVEEWGRLDAVPAVEHGCVRIVAGDWALILGPRLPKLYRALREAIASCPIAAPKPVERPAVSTP